MTFEECMKFISSYSRLGKKVTDLSRARELMERVGDPQNDLKFIHIAGTNGKGSTLEYISNALIYSGYKTGQFTSPYVTHYTDRIRINSHEIAEKDLGEICEFVAERVAEREYSQFEITMAIAMLWFVREKCDVVVLEAGIGGLLDSTNVIPPPLLSVITSISLDHTAILGDTVEKIARQKAGIIKEGSAVVVADGNAPNVVRIMKSTAKKKNAEFILTEPCSKDTPTLIDGTPFTYKGESFKAKMLGYAQGVNASLAIEVCRYLGKKGYNISEENIKQSISNTQVKARMQIVSLNPDILIDGGHNPDGIKNLTDLLYLWNCPVYTVMGMVDSKDYEDGIKKISVFSEKFFTVDDFAANAIPAERLAEIAEKNTSAEPCKSLSEAVEKAKALALENDGIVVICGSLYLASKYLNEFG